MPDPSFTGSDLFSIIAAEQAGPSVAVCGLPSADSYLTVGDNPLALRARNVVEAASTLHHCHRHDSRCWLGGLCLIPISTEFVTGLSGITASWTTHDLPLNWNWRAACSHTCQPMKAVPDSVLDVFGDLEQRHGTGSTWLETGRCGQQTEAGR